MKARIHYEGVIIKRGIFEGFVHTVEREEYIDPFSATDWEATYPVSYNVAGAIIEGALVRITRKVGTKIWYVE